MKNADCSSTSIIHFRKLLVQPYLILISTLLLSCSIIPGRESLPSEEYQIASPELGDIAPDFSLGANNGETIELAKLTGHPILLNFWASWCGPCRAEMPDIQLIYEIFESKGLIVLGVNNEETATDVSQFGLEFDLTFPLLLDLDGKVAEQYLINAFPTTFFIDENGIIQHIQIGSMDKAAIEDLLLEKLKLAEDMEESPTSANENLTPPSPTPDLEKVELKGCVTTESLRVRSGPGTNYSVIDGLVKGDCRSFDARDTTDGWLRITINYASANGERYWVSADYIDLEGNINDLPRVEK